MDVKILQGGDNLTDPLLVRDRVFTREQGFTIPDADEFDPLSTHVVVYDQAKPVATGRCYPDPAQPDSWHIGRICVLREQRGKDLGLLLMRRLEEICAQNGAKQLVLGAQLYAVPFYEKCGFFATGDRYFEEFCEHEMMGKNL